METRHLTDNEVNILKAELHDEMNFIKKLAVGAVAIGIISPLIPLGLTRSGMRSGVSGSLVDYCGAFEAYSFSILIVLAFITLFFYLKPAKLMKDIKERKVVMAEVYVEKIENLKPDVISMMAKGEDTILHFINNKYRVRNYYFQKRERPELLKAEKMLIERAIHSQVEFKSEMGYIND